LELTVEANDPKDRKIEYKLFTLGLEKNLSIKQKENIFDIKIDDYLVANSVSFWLSASTPNSSYQNRAMKSLQLTILPE